MLAQSCQLREHLGDRLFQSLESSVTAQPWLKCLVSSTLYFVIEKVKHKMTTASSFALGSGGGMANLGNSCYLNSSLQALFHIPSVEQFLREVFLMHIPNCPSGLRQSPCVICAMGLTYYEAQQSSIIKPTRIVNLIVTISKKALQPFRQEDSHEFLK